MNDDRIERDQQDSNLTTADLARSAEAESEERTREKLHANSTADNRSSTADTRDARPTPMPTPIQTPMQTDVRSARDTGATRVPVTGTGAATATAPAREGEYARLFSESDAKDFRQRWENLQVGFVDEPRRAVEQADSLVAEAIKRLAEVFANERENLEKQWDRGDNVSTEDLRLALQRYRAFFGRLLSV